MASINLAQPPSTSPGHTVTATIACQYCNCRWSARMTGDTVSEVADFLQRRLRVHVDDHHAKAVRQ